MKLRVVPELYCTDIHTSVEFFIHVLGFEIKYQRPEEHFAYLTRSGVDLMLERLSSPSRKWITQELVAPFGRGINFQWDVDNIDSMYADILKRAPDSIYLPMESKGYQVKEELVIQKQFIIQVPDGYLFRFCQDDVR